MASALVDALSGLDEEKVIKIVKERLAKKEDPLKILEDARAGMEIIGKKFADCEYFIPDLVYSGEILAQIAELTKGATAKTGGLKKAGTVVIGTVATDIHDIGKNIVGFMLDVNGFEVIDVGVDVPPEKFVEAIKKHKPQVVALSGFLTSCFSAMKEAVDAIEAAGLRKNVKIMIGGGQIDEHVSKFAKADGWGTDAMAGVKMAKQWVGG